jgi:hypothetical protein
MVFISKRVEIISVYIFTALLIGFLLTDYFMPYKMKSMNESPLSLLLLLVSGLYLAYISYFSYSWLSIIVLLFTYRYIRRSYMPYELTDLNDFIDGENSRWTNKCIDTLQ